MSIATALPHVAQLRPGMMLRVGMLGESELVSTGVSILLHKHASSLRLVDRDWRGDTDVDIVLCDSLSLEAARRTQLDARMDAAGTRYAEFSWLQDPHLVRQARNRGAAGYVYKGLDGAELVHALEKIAMGDWYGPADAAATDNHARADRASCRAGLSDRETEMLVSICAGLSNNDIAARCYLSINSVKTYIRSCYRKIGVSRRSEAVIWAFEHDFVAPEIRR